MLVVGPLPERERSAHGAQRKRLRIANGASTERQRSVDGAPTERQRGSSKSTYVANALPEYEKAHSRPIQTFPTLL